MPELPELTAQAERLDAAFNGASLARFEALSFTVLKTVDPPPDALVGHELIFVGRRGKYLLLDFGEATFVVHLMQGGRLEPDEKQAKKPRNGMARWVFEDGRALLLTEPGTERKAGVWVIKGDPEEVEPLAGLGPDADTVPSKQLHEIFRANSARLHTVLRRQSAIAGIGRRLANEVCHRAKISPFANAAKLEVDETGAVAEAIRACINESLAEERGREQMGNVADRTSRVHGRTGEPCPVDGEPIREVAYRGYTVYYCPTCQTDGKILADNTTSKFLK